jgi:glycerol-3-phosphate dehydrogenase
MKREEMMAKVARNSKIYDFIIIGGGATGIGIALEASTRGYSVLLLEKFDFTKSTSSKSTKLVHGGVRYLAQGNIGLVREAIVERGLLLKNAPHIVKKISFIIPTLGFIEQTKYLIALKLYDLLAGSLSLGKSRLLRKKDVLKRLTTLNPTKISSGILYFDGQFNDSRLAINVIQTAVENGAVALNYCSVNGLLKNNNRMIDGVRFIDEESTKEYEVKGRQIVNATGVFTDEILKMDMPNSKNSITPSQGIHLVLDTSFLPGDDAIMIPKTPDGRVLFLIPWCNKVLLGTTDTPIANKLIEPIALESEINFILETATRYLTKSPKRSDVLSVFAGLRPLAASSNENSKTKEISRSHKIITSKSGMLTMIGGKWTTFRKMGEELVDAAENRLKWNSIATKTKKIKIHGFTDNIDSSNSLESYGADANKILNLAKQKGMGDLLSVSLNIIKAQVVWAVRHEMARTVEDFLARRTRCQILNAKESIKIAPQVASIMANEMGYLKCWEDEQVTSYTKITLNYIL